MKLLEATTLDVIKSVVDGTFTGGTAVGTLANGGVALAPFHDADSLVSDEVKAELEQLKADIISGTISVD